MLAIQLTSEQQKALTAIGRFLSSGNEQIFLLKGYAGTGKTTILKEVIALVEAQKRKFLLMAPTGRAARILGGKTAHDAYTIHKSVYLLDDERITEQGAHTAIFSLGQNSDPTDALYIVDEASMVSDVRSDSESLQFGSGRLLADLIEYVQPRATRRKIIFCGDPAQLPPVGMNSSPALKKDYLGAAFGLSVMETTLTEIHRQAKGNPILATADTLRRQLKSQAGVQFSIQADGRHIVRKEAGALLEWYAGLIRDKDIPNATWICHTNSACNEVNRDVRSYLGFLRADIEPGEILMVNRNNYANGELLLNGDLVRVQEISDRAERHTITYNHKDKTGLKTELCFRDALIHPLDKPEQCLKVKLLENTLHDHDPTLFDVANFVFCQQRHRQSGRKTDFRMFRRSDPYINALQARYGYAITCHKAQGGEWEQVVVDFTHPAETNKHAFIRWAYTAITRAVNRLCIFTEVASGPFSKLIVNQIQFLRRIRQVAQVPDYYIEDDDPEVFQAYPFLKPVVESIAHGANESGLKVSVEYMPYRARFTATKGAQTCIADITWTKKGINPGLVPVKCTGNELLKKLDSIMEAATGNTPPEAVPPAETFRAMLFDELMALFSELDIPFRGLMEADWHDAYLMDTDHKGSELVCWYNKDGRFTRIEPKSLIGGADKKLAELVGRLSRMR